jgi:RNA-directed DNA polymerase
VHHALCRVLDAIWERRFIHDTYACRPGKGTHKAIDRCQQYARSHAYVL